MAKTVRVSDDNGVTWHSLPGSSAEKNIEAASADDTIFGQSFQSSQTTLKSLTVTANSVYKGFAGYKATIKRQGTTTAFSDEGMTLVTGKRYRITDTDKDLWDRNVAITVYDDGVDVTDKVIAINYLFGEIVFDSDYTVTTPVTVSGSYFPTANLGNANSLNLGQTAEEIATTTFQVANSNGGYSTRDPGLRQVSVDLDGIFNATSSLASILTNEEEVIIEINPDGNGKSRCRGYFKSMGHGQGGDVGALETENVGFELSVPEGVEFPFAWQHAANTTLSRAVRICLDAWENETKIKIQYLHDGVNGQEFTAMVADASIETSLDGMNTFSFSFPADGAPVAVP